MEDTEILKLIRNGNVQSFRLLVEKYHCHLCNFIYSLVFDRDVIEDIAQEIFLNVYKSLEGFDVDRGVPFSAWLFIIARNKCISELRKRKLQFIYLNDFEHVKSNDISNDEHERMTVLSYSLDKLEEPFKSTIVESLKGSSIDEIAKKCGVSSNTIKTRLFRGREKLKQFFIKASKGD